MVSFFDVTNRLLYGIKSTACIRDKSGKAKRGLVPSVSYDNVRRKQYTSGPQETYGDVGGLVPTIVWQISYWRRGQIMPAT